MKRKHEYQRAKHDQLRAPPHFGFHGSQVHSQKLPHDTDTINIRQNTGFVSELPGEKVLQRYPGSIKVGRYYDICSFSPLVDFNGREHSEHRGLYAVTTVDCQCPLSSASCGVRLPCERLVLGRRCTAARQMTT